MIEDDNNRDKLLELMALSGVKAEDLPELTSYSESMVKAWLMPDRTSKRARAVPGRAIEMLRLKLEKVAGELLHNN